MTIPFIETPRFPDDLACWADGGRSFRTICVETFGGNEWRTAAWQMTRGEWEIHNAWRNTKLPAGNAYGATSLITLFRACYGQLYGFRFKDFRDDQDWGAGVLGTTGLGVAATTAYQMFKNYAVSPVLQQNIIQKPVAATIKVYIAGVLKSTPGDYALDATTGMVTFTSQPGVGLALTWTGDYDCPVRFASDIPAIGLDESSGALLNWQSLKLMELRNL